MERPDEAVAPPPARRLVRTRGALLRRGVRRRTWWLAVVDARDRRERRDHVADGDRRGASRHAAAIARVDLRGPVRALRRLLRRRARTARGRRGQWTAAARASAADGDRAVR